MEESSDDALVIPGKVVPWNFGPLQGATHHARLKGPCGDTMEYWLKVNGTVIEQATFTTDGCHHSIRCGSIGALIINGSTTSLALKLQPEDILALAADIPRETAHCATLSINTIRAALAAPSQQEEQP